MFVYYTCPQGRWTHDNRIPVAEYPESSQKGNISRIALIDALKNTQDLTINPDNGRSLPLMETFYTLQGEGAHTGKAAFFVRIGGCDVGCYWCDTRESWKAGLHPLTPVEEIVRQALQYPARAVVITGGEPLLYNLGPLTDQLHSQGFQTFLETSGSENLSGSWDWICLSPKRRSPPVKQIEGIADELKIIVFEEEDYEWAEEMAARTRPSCEKFLQPEWSRRDQVMPGIIRYILDNPQWKISLQSHKYMKIP